MPKRIIQPIGGVLRDPPSVYLKDGALSEARNVRVRDGSLQSVPGYVQAYGTPSGAPLWLQSAVLTASSHAWVYADDADIYIVDEGSSHTEISKSTGAYSATAAKGWNGGLYSNIVVMNNGVDVPQEWTINYSTPGTASDLSNWESDIASSATCKSLRPFRQYLIAMNTTESGTDYLQRVRWSDAGSAGSTPTWDATDPAQDAGFEELLDSYDPIVDGLPLRDQFVVYKENETYLMRLVGGAAVFTFRRIFKTTGMLAPDCAVEYRGRHYVLTQGDVVVHDGNTVQSLIDRDNRSWLFSQIDSVNFDRSFVALNEEDDEIWFCFPEDGESYATRALTFSLQDGTWGDRDLPGVRFIAKGEINQTGSTTWANISGDWDAQTSRWNESAYNPAEQRLLMAGTADTKIYEVGNSSTADGTAFRAAAIRESDSFGDTDEFVRVLRVRPIVEANNGTVFTIKLGVQNKLSDAITYTEYTFTQGTDEQVNTRVQGKYISWEIETEEDTSWSLHGIEFEYNGMGRR